MEIFVSSIPPQRRKKLGTAPIGVFFPINDSQSSTETKLYFFLKAK
jgi:hypothetical protein